MSLRNRLLHFLRVPPEPAAPPGDERVRVFRAAPNYFRYRVAMWSLSELGGLLGIVAYFTLPDWIFPRWFLPFRFGDAALEIGPITIGQRIMSALFWTVEIVGVTVFFVQAVASGLLLRLDFEQRWYLVSDRSLRIREGLVRLNEKTMTFVNVQHVAIRQNPIQRWLGIADLEVRTAGGGSTDAGEHGDSKELHIAYFRGVNNADEIRDVIRERLKAAADAGLGDPDDPEHRPAVAAPLPPAADDLVQAAGRLRDEAHALRKALTSSV